MKLLQIIVRHFVRETAWEERASTSIYIYPDSNPFTLFMLWNRVHPNRHLYIPSHMTEVDVEEYSLFQTEAFNIKYYIEWGLDMKGA